MPSIRARLYDYFQQTRNTKRLGWMLGAIIVGCIGVNLLNMIWHHQLHEVHDQPLFHQLIDLDFYQAIFWQLISWGVVIGIVVYLWFHFTYSQAAIDDLRDHASLQDQSLQLIKSAVNQAQDAVIITDHELNPPGPRILYMNEAAQSLTGWTLQEALLRNPRIFHGPRTDKSVFEAMRRTLQSNRPFQAEVINYNKTGREYLIELQISPIIRDGKVANYVSVYRDITQRRADELKRKELEKQVEHLQRTESIGLLTSGIAHDFNNMLQPMLGLTSLVRRQVPEQSPIQPHLERMEQIAHKAKGLTEQLLGYVRKEPTQSAIVTINHELERSIEFVRPMISKNTLLQVVPSPHTLTVKLDPLQLTQVLMNLIKNASEAMPDGQGIIQIETFPASLSDVKLEKDRVGPEPDSLVPHYACLSVRDDGCGLSEAAMKRIFDPYFSLKGAGGTGLGLAIVKRVAEQHQAVLAVQSTPNVGTTIKVYWPIEDTPTALKKVKATTATASSSLPSKQRPSDAAQRSSASFVQKKKMFKSE